MPAGDEGGALIEKIKRMQLILLYQISQEGYEHPNKYMDEYRELRAELLAMAQVKPLLPHFIDENLDLRMFWRFIRRQYPTYEKRREHLERAFARTLGMIGSDPK